MPHMLEFQLTNSRGLGQVIYCHGLETPVIIAPTVHGEPLLTAQAFYYLEELEAVARMSTDEISEEHHISEEHLTRRCEYILDNYLFAYSVNHPESQLTTRVTDFKYWEYRGEPYRGYDQNHTKALALDGLNDETILSIENEDYSTKMAWADWCLITAYTNGIFSDYTRAMQQCIRKHVEVQTENHEYLGTGRHRLPLVTPSVGLLDYSQALGLDTIRKRDVVTDAGTVLVSRGHGGLGDFRLQLETVHITRSCNSDLLAYYFAGLRERVSIAQFRCFYNVLEYFFESAPKELGESASKEREQLSCVVRYVADAADITKFFDRVGDDYGAAIQEEIETASGQKIRSIGMEPCNIAVEVSRWIYDIRCACIHSKATRHGSLTARFVPFSNDENAVALAIPLLQWLAVRCIEKDSE
jgi:hypothetical protein